MRQRPAGSQGLRALFSLETAVEPLVACDTSRSGLTQTVNRNSVRFLPSCNVNKFSAERPTAASTFRPRARQPSSLKSNSISVVRMFLVAHVSARSVSALSTDL